MHLSQLLDAVAVTRVLIADDYPLFRDGLRAAIAATPDLHLVCEAPSGEDAYALVRTFHPDVVLLGDGMPGLPTPDLVRLLAQHYPTVRVLLLVHPAHVAQTPQLRQLPLRGCLLKSEPTERILQALRTVAQGACAWSEGLMQQSTSVQAAADGLTEREREVVRLLAEGHKNKAIARALQMSEATVCFHLSNVYAKLQLSRAEVIAWAVRQGRAAVPAAAQPTRWADLDTELPVS